MTQTQALTRHNNRYGGSVRSPETTEERIKRAARRPGGYDWPDLRVGRNFDIKQSVEWDVFLNALQSYKNRADNNSRKGHAYVAAAIACHFVADKEVRAMVQAKYDFRSPEKAEITYSAIKRRLNDFILSEQGFYSPRNNGRLVESELFRQTQNPQQFYAAPHFAPAQLEVGELYGYGRRKWGFDLSRNEFLHDERDVVLKYMRREEGFDTTLVDKDWEPHGTVFELYENLRIDEVAPTLPKNPVHPAFLPVLSVAAS